MKIALPPLPYAYDALEPYMSAETLRAHHDAHHGGYIDKLNALIQGTEFEGASLESIIRRTAGVRRAQSIFNNAAQAWNHAFFWRSLRPKRYPGAPQSTLASGFSGAIKAAAATYFGSGWIWLVDEDGALKVTATANADTPIVHGQRPLLALDLWEHAYYLDHQWRRGIYVADVVEHVFNWESAEHTYLNGEAIYA